MAKSKPRARDLKKQRWVSIVAIILAIGMVVSLVGVYIEQVLRGDQAMPPEQQAEPQPEDYLAYYQEQVDRLESFLADNEPTEAVLLELAENYRYLEYIRQIYFDDQESLQMVRDRLGSIYLSLVELEPDKLPHRLELINYYLSVGRNEPAMEQIALIIDQLHANPDPRYHLSLVGLLSSAGQNDPVISAMATEEIEWLKIYFEERAAAGPLVNQEQFYYAVLLGEYLNERASALEILTVILGQEDVESSLYQDVLGYRDYLNTMLEAEQSEVQPVEIRE